ncbi:hypothetical protein [Aquimarina algiphila]|uniref:hypothetical protein n=1 Tax=Aquimarina algiphila TaxID=2047982 RepID=UPI0023308C5D|nr:hypothetical protein [Aquimarina algiphila]
MKKRAIIIGFSFGVVLMSSCTDNTMKGIDENENIQKKQIENVQVFRVDKRKIRRPGSQGN